MAFGYHQRCIFPGMSCSIKTTLILNYFPMIRKGTTTSVKNETVINRIVPRLTKSYSLSTVGSKSIGRSSSSSWKSRNPYGGNQISTALPRRQLILSSSNTSGLSGKRSDQRCKSTNISNRNNQNRQDKEATEHLLWGIGFFAVLAAFNVFVIFVETDSNTTSNTNNNTHQRQVCADSNTNSHNNKNNESNVRDTNSNGSNKNIVSF